MYGRIEITLQQDERGWQYRLDVGDGPEGWDNYVYATADECEDAALEALKFRGLGDRKVRVNAVPFGGPCVH